MMSHFYRAILVLVYVIGLVFPFQQIVPQAAAAQPPAPEPEVEYAAHQDTSHPLRDMVAALGAAALPRQGNAAPLLDLPKAQTDSSWFEAGQPDASVQSQPGTARMPAPQTNFEGIGGNGSVIPPDSNGAIGYDAASGKHYYFQWVNLSYRVWDVSNPASPVVVLGPFAGKTIWAGFGTPCEYTDDGDPIVLFDRQAGRWFVTQFSIGLGQYYQCLAVSASADPAGSWYRYAYLYSPTKLNDYSKFGIWPDGYYMSVNQFVWNGTNWDWAGAGAVAYEREKMLQGLPARKVKFDLAGVSLDYGGMLPSDLDGTLPPPVGAPNPFVEWDDSSWSPAFSGGDAIRIWNFHVDWNDPSASTFGQAGEPNVVVPTTDVTPIDPNWGVSQPGTITKLDPLGDRLMFRSQYRNFGAYQTLVTNHTVDAGGYAGLHWFELRQNAAVWSLFQDGVYAPDSLSRWMASAALDGSGNMAIGYSASGGAAGQYPSIRYSGRLAGDPLGTLPQSEVTLITSSAFQNGSNRWGDYSSMTLDPLDDCTFWYTQQYTAGGFSWRTRIASFRYPGCTAGAVGELTGLVTDQDSVPLSGVRVASGDFETQTGANGVYHLLLPTGSQDVTFRQPGYLPVSETAQIADGSQTTLNVMLSLTDMVTVRGSVVDGSGHTGLPLYARIDVSNYPAGPVYTDPMTGEYTLLALSAESDYTLIATAVSGGYLAQQQNIITPAALPAPSDTVVDFSLLIDSDKCAAAPGYRLSGGVLQHFDDGGLPQSWQVLDSAGAGITWRFDNPYGAVNNTGGSGLFAGVDDATSNTRFDTALISPLFDFSGQAVVNLSFRIDINNPDNSMRNLVDVSIDGGQTWQTVWLVQTSQFGPMQVGPLDISSQVANHANVRVRFRAFNITPSSINNHGWQLDDVQINQAPECIVQPGALLYGTVTDANTGLALTGASVQAGSEITLSQAVPAGFYQLWVPQGVVNVQASLNEYGPQTLGVSLMSDSVNWQDMLLPAGQLGFDPPSLDVTLLPGAQTNLPVNLANQGGYTAAYSLAVIDTPVTDSVPTGPFASTARRLSPKRANEMDASHLYNQSQPGAPDWPQVQVVQTWQSNQFHSWGLLPLPDGSLWLGWPGAQALNRFAMVDQTSLAQASLLPWAGVFGADLAYQPLTGRMWQVNVGGDNCIHELVAENGRPVGNAVCPNFGASQRGLAYDPLSGSFYSGSWNDGIIHHFDATGQMLDSYATGLNVAGLAYHPLSRRLYALVNTSQAIDVYVLDTRNAYQILGGFSIQGMSDFGQAGLEFAPDGHLWALDGDRGQVFELSVGEGPLDLQSAVSWVTVTPANGNIAPDQSQPLSLHIDALGLPPGAYQIYLQASENTPYAAPVLPVTVRIVSLKVYLPAVIH